MTEKQASALETILSLLPDEYRNSYRAVAESAVSLGYMPVLKGKRKDYCDFTNAKLKRTLLKINADPKHRCISLKFYALPAYSPLFQDAVDKRLIYWRKLGYAAKCFGCGMCNGTEGYPCALPGGESGFLCGFGLIPIPAFSPENVAEVMEAMQTQHAYFARQAAV